MQAFQDLKDLTGGKLQYVHIKVGIHFDFGQIILTLDSLQLSQAHCDSVIGGS